LAPTLASRFPKQDGRVVGRNKKSTTGTSSAPRIGEKNPSEARQENGNPAAAFEKPWDKRLVAQYLGISPSGLDKLLANGRGPPGFRAGRLRRWRPSVVRAWAEAQEHTASDEKLTHEISR
jgi:hypothetical protein